MPKVTHVARAQQRYEMRPVLDAAGEPRQVLTTRKTKTGRAVYRDVTERDLSKPLPPFDCDSCGRPIKVGTPYKWIAPRSGPYGGRRLNRHESCPTWNVWEYSNSLSAQIERITHDARQSADTDDVSSTAEALRSAAEEIRALAEEKRASAENVESGFGHETELSQELNDTADQLESWADEIEQKADEIESEYDGESLETIKCEECDGDGEIDNSDREAISEALDDALSVLDECPI